jgi:hypothetical protein
MVKFSGPSAMTPAEIFRQGFFSDTCYRGISLLGGSIIDRFIGQSMMEADNEASPCLAKLLVGRVERRLKLTNVKFCQKARYPRLRVRYPVFVGNVFSEGGEFPMAD